MSKSIDIERQSQQLKSASNQSKIFEDCTNRLDRIKKNDNVRLLSSSTSSMSDISYDPNDPENFMSNEDYRREELLRREDQNDDVASINLRQPKSIKSSRRWPMYESLIDQQPQPKQPSMYSFQSKTNRIDDLYTHCSYHLAFTMIERNSNERLFGAKLLNKFSNSLTSILLHLNATRNDQAQQQNELCIHLITDDRIRLNLRETIDNVHRDLGKKSYLLTNMPHQRTMSSSEERFERFRPMVRYFFIDSYQIDTRLEYLLPTLRNCFTHKINSYYSQALFFYSMFLHQVIPNFMANRLILLDIDIQLDTNILKLFEEFDRFKEDEIIGIAYEQQPVYRHILHEYRRDNINTTAGSPPPQGFPGFNSGVLLLDLERMRRSKLYQSLLSPKIIEHLSQKYRFRGHLGDQDFYTLIGIDHRSLFHVLPCGWNRQLCQWWRFHGYGEVFDDYHRCQTSSIMLYHGNCNSALPTLTNYGDYRRRK
ncbi:Xyloside xylosyltransferase 1 [Sarcoptes scabiei]|uniref:Xyloside xylosyltransferase 1 n=2 Tax=Sarcoptes scabiei TaxID=52283 RepID=A0A834R9Z0_SARSC|nr:Xyloside xylosyltransferase 1 [Sarcoptes scabiei]